MWDWTIDYLPLIAGTLATGIQTYQQTKSFNESHHKVGITLVGLLYLFACIGLLGLVLQTHKKRVQSIDDKKKSDAFELRATVAEGKLNEATNSLRELQIEVNALPKNAEVDDLRKRVLEIGARLGIKQELALATLNLSDQLGTYLAASDFQKTLVPTQPNPNMSSDMQLQRIRERDTLRKFSISEHFRDISPALRSQLDRLRSQGIDTHNAQVCEATQPTIEQIESCSNELRTIGNNLLK